jgi:hypothetical protein
VEAAGRSWLDGLGRELKPRPDQGMAVSAYLSEAEFGAAAVYLEKILDLRQLGSRLSPEHGKTYVLGGSPNDENCETETAIGQIKG